MFYVVFLFECFNALFALGISSQCCVLGHHFRYCLDSSQLTNDVVRKRSQEKKKPLKVFIRSTNSRKINVFLVFTPVAAK